MIEARLLRLCRVFGLLFLVLACKARTEVAEGGSETHFLSTCEAECSEGFVCRCGVCTQECADTLECSELSPNATCVPLAPRVAQGRCGVADAIAICDATCVTDNDCSDVSDGRRCLDGYCRDSDAVASGNDPLVCEAADIASSELVVIGDSLIQLSSFTAHLEASAVASGELGADEHYRSYASATMSFLAENSFNIGSQYTTSQQGGAVRAVVMNGGATDMLQYPCRGALTPECPGVVAAVTGAQRLFARMARDGVEHVVYFFYPDPRSDDVYQEGLDVLRPLIENVCGSSPIPCHWIDLRPTFAGHDEYLGLDGIVFSEAGAQAAASVTWQLMRDRCVPR